MLIHIEIPVPPSLNHAYYNNPGKGRGRILTNFARAFKEEVTLKVRTQLEEDLDPKSTYGLVIILHTNRKRDVSNIIKLTEDAAFDGIGINDWRNFAMCAFKEPSKETWCELYIGHLPEIKEFLRGYVSEPVE